MSELILQFDNIPMIDRQLAVEQVALEKALSINAPDANENASALRRTIRALKARREDLAKAKG